jgi:hypothetical protein
MSKGDSHARYIQQAMHVSRAVRTICVFNAALQAKRCASDIQNTSLGVWFQLGDFVVFLVGILLFPLLVDIRATRAQVFFFRGSIRMVLDFVGESLPGVVQYGVRLIWGQGFWILWSASG